MNLRLFVNRFGGLVVAPFLLVAMLESSVEANARVVVLKIRGPKGGMVRNQIVRQLEEKYEVLGPSDYTATARDVGVKANASADSVSKIAPALQAQAVVTGRVIRKRRNWQLRVGILDGASGDELDANTFKITKRGARGPSLKRVVNFLLDAIAEGDMGRASGAESYDEEETPADLGEEDADNIDEGGDEGEEADAEDAPAEEGDGELGDRPAGVPLVEASVGVTLVARTFEYGENTSALRNYNGSMVPGVAFGIESYPMLLLTRGILAHFGLAFSYGQVFTLKSRLEEDDEEISTTLRELGVGARFRYGFGQSGPVIKGIVDYGQITFDVDWGNRVVELPNAKHGFIRIGAEGHIPIGSIPLRAVAAAAFLLVIGNSGDLDGSGGYGFDIDAGGDWLLLDGALSIGPRFSFTRITVNDPETLMATVTSSNATDQYLGGSLNVGFSF